MSKSNWKTAEEISAELAVDKTYIDSRRTKDEEIKKRREDLTKAEAPLVRELNRAGVQVRSVWDLVNSTSPYPVAIPILFRHLEDTSYPEKVREGILRALAVPEARQGWSTLLEIFEKEPSRPSGGLKWAAACALSAASDETVIKDVINLAKDERYGINRVALLNALKRSSNPECKMVLNELQNDPVVGKEIKRLRRLDRVRDGRMN